MLFSNTIAGSVDSATRHTREKFLFNDAVNSAISVGGNLNMGMSTNGTMILTGKNKQTNKQSQSYFVHEKSQTHWSGTEIGPPIK
jgi:hypothetical protein